MFGLPAQFGGVCQWQLVLTCGMRHSLVAHFMLRDILWFLGALCGRFLLTLGSSNLAAVPCRHPGATARVPSASCPVFFQCSSQMHEQNYLVGLIETPCCPLGPTWASSYPSCKPCRLHAVTVVSLQAVTTSWHRHHMLTVAGPGGMTSIKCTRW